MSTSTSPARLGATDPNSYAVPEDIRTKNIDLDWQINFDKKTISGNANYTFQVQNEKSVSQLLLDIDDIDIASIVHNDSNEQLKYTVSDFVKTIGSKLTIELPAGTNGEFQLTISYETSPQASALQWLSPAQTLGKQQPYLFSQCQPIQARSLLPCQDTPAVKFTYRATVRHPANLTALLSAVRLPSDRTDITKYAQTVPIPSYLLAIAVGDIVSRPLGPISNVWAEAAIVDEAATEFSETADMLRIASEICGPYVWHQYDLLVMPPSFPFGGMENPCLTFVTPTLLAGDKSLANVVAHEIAHSWTGNLVTNANFEHFWLNEGFTVFVEGKITGAMGGAPARDFQAIQGLSELRDTIRGQLAGEPQLTKLVPDLSGPISPEDSFSSVPYMKGQTFLRYIEDTLGGPAVFDPFLRAYFAQYKYQSIVTEQFRDALHSYFEATKPTELAQIDWDLWLFGTGMPPVVPVYDDSLARVSREHADLWVGADSVAAIRASPLLAAATGLTSLQRVELLNLLIANDAIRALSTEWIELLEATYALGASATKNCDLRCRFVRLCVKARLTERLPEVLAFANSNFRMKYVRPIYRDLAGWAEAKSAAVDNYERVKEQMMAVCANQVAKDLGIN